MRCHLNVKIHIFMCLHFLVLVELCVCVPTYLCVWLGLCLYIRRICMCVCTVHMYVCMCLSMYGTFHVALLLCGLHDRTEGRVVSAVRKALWISVDLHHTSKLAAACLSYLNSHIKNCLSDEKLKWMITSITWKDWEGAELCLHSPNTLPYHRTLALGNSLAQYVV